MVGRATFLELQSRKSKHSRDSLTPSKQSVARPGQLMTLPPISVRSSAVGFAQGSGMAALGQKSAVPVRQERKRSALIQPQQPILQDAIQRPHPILHRIFFLPVGTPVTRSHLFTARPGCASSVTSLEAEAVLGERHALISSRHLVAGLHVAPLRLENTVVASVRNCSPGSARSSASPVKAAPSTTSASAARSGAAVWGARAVVFESASAPDVARSRQNPHAAPPLPWFRSCRISRSGGARPPRATRASRRENRDDQFQASTPLAPSSRRSA